MNFAAVGWLRVFNSGSARLFVASEMLQENWPWNNESVCLSGFSSSSMQ